MPINIAAPYCFSDYVHGRDAARSAALDYQERGPLGAALLSAARLGGEDAVLKAAESFRVDPVNRYDDLALHIRRQRSSSKARNDRKRRSSSRNWRRAPSYRDAFWCLASSQRQTVTKSWRGRQPSAAYSSIRITAGPAPSRNGQRPGGSTSHACARAQTAPSVGFWGELFGSEASTFGAKRTSSTHEDCAKLS
jgi:hypothetical protein